MQEGLPLPIPKAFRSSVVLPCPDLRVWPPDGGCMWEGAFVISSRGLDALCYGCPRELICSRSQSVICRRYAPSSPQARGAPAAATLTSFIPHTLFPDSARDGSSSSCRSVRPESRRVSLVSALRLPALVLHLDSSCAPDADLSSVLTPHTFCQFVTGLLTF